MEDGCTLMLASGDGGFLSDLYDFESLIGAARSAVVVIYNDAAYGAEIHQYGFQILTEKLMLIPELDAAASPGPSVPNRRSSTRLRELSALTDWIDAGARGTFVADCRITSSVRDPWLSERMAATRAAKAAMAG